MKIEILNKGIIPSDVIKLISVLTENNKSAYIVGGCVRDLILGEEPHDYDICTELTPEETMKLLDLNNIVFYESGIAFGTITAILNKNEYEITTYRKETGYEDSRHPNKVVFVRDIHEDLKRRDFTINAMAYNPLTDEFVDDFNGLQDLCDGIIRAVGDANKRFKEDALRILRALRFSIRFQCTIEEETLIAMKRNAGLLDNISKERITDELRKMLTCGKPIRHAFLKCDWLIGQVIPEIKDCFHFNQNNKYHKHDVYEHILTVVDNCKTTKFEVKMAALLHDIGKPKAYVEDEEGYGHFYGHPKISYDMSCELLKKHFRLSNEQYKEITDLVLYHDMEVIPKKSSVKRAISKFNDITAFTDWFISKQADMDDHKYPEGNCRYKIDISGIKKVLQQIIDEHSALNVRDLEINGNILMKEFGLKPGKQIGFILQTLLDEVIDEKIDNDAEKLLLRSHELISGD